MTGRGGFREAQIVTQDIIDKFKPPEEDEEPKKTKKNKVPKARNVPVKKIKPNKERFETEQEEKKILLSVHEEKMDKLQKKYDKLEEKEAATRKENKTLKSDLAKMKKSYNTEKSKREDLEDKYKKLHDTCEQREKDLKALRKSGGDVSNEIISKDKEIESLSKDIKKKDKEIESLRGENSDLKDKISTLEADLEELKENRESGNEDHQDEGSADDPAGVISRISSTGFQSDLFTSSRYKVSLSRDGSYMTFKVDIMGSATCISGKIDLPSVSKYLPFNGRIDYPVELMPDGGMLIRLR